MAHAITRLAALTLALCCGTFAASAAAPAETIALRPQIEITGPTVRISDVFDGVPAAIDREIAAAPQPGKSITYDARVLSRVAEKYRLNWQPQSLADKAVVTRASTVIDAGMITAAVVRQLAEDNVKGKANVALDKHDLALYLPADEAPDFRLRNFTYDPLAKRFRAEIVTGDAAAPLIKPISGRVSIMREVPAALRRMTAGTVIGAADLIMVEMPEERIQRDAVTDMAQLLNMEVRQDVAEGDMLLARDLMPQRLVTRGSLVTLRIETPFMQITAQGKALQHGSKGETIRVTNTQSNRIVEGIVEAPGVVRIINATRTASAG